MKKVLSLFLCILMLMSAAIPAFAATEILSVDEVTRLGFGRFWGNDAVWGSSSTDRPKLDTAPAKYLFKTADTTDKKEYILLQNVNAGENDGYFVMLNEYTEKGIVYDTVAGNYKFDPEYTTSIASRINAEDYITTNFPLMSSYINNHTWYTEHYDTDKETAYKTICKIALPSLTEYKLNADRIGLKIVNGSWWTRTPYTDGKSVWILNCYDYNRKIEAKATNDENANRAIRPCFYLDESFFKNVKLDMTLLKTEGSAAAEILKNIANTEDGLNALKNIYTVAELAEIGISGSVKITNATLTGTGNCGDTLVATAETNLPEGNEPAYEWVRVNADNTTTTLDCTANSYTVKFDDLGASIKCLIKVFDGETLSDSKYTNAITTEAKPTFETCASLKITADNSQGVKTTPEAYKFSFDGSEFVLLKSVNANENDGQFVATVSNIINDVNKADLNWYATDILALKKFVYDPNNTDSIANKINNEDFWNEKTVSNTTLIPNDMRSYLEKHRWWNEQINTTDVYSQEAFATESKVALLSYTEYVRNINRIGYNDTNSTRGILTRSAFYKTSGGYTLENPNIITISANEDTGKYRISNLTTTSGDGKKGLIGYYQNKKIAFYLDPLFFAEQKVDFTSANTEVIAVLKEALKGKSAGELVGMGYTTEQIGYISDAKIGKVAMYGFTKGENGTITFTCKNMTSDDVSFIPAAAAYDNGAMVSVYFANSAVEIPAGETKEVTVTLSTSGNAQIKVFAWDKTNLTPYAPVAEVK